MQLSRRQRRATIMALVVTGAILTPFIAAVLGDYLSDSADVSGPVGFNASNGTRITLTGSTTANLTNPFPSNNTVELRTSNGNVSFIGPPTTNATIDVTNINGTKTNVTEINATLGEIYVNPGDKPAINVTGDLDNITFRSMKLDDDTTDFRYAGASGETNVTVRGLTGDTKMIAVDANTGTVLGIGTTNGNGNVSLLEMPNSEHTVELESSSDAPVLTNATPNGDVLNAPDELSVDVDDDEYPADNVTLEFYVEGSKIDTKHSNTSASTVTTTALPEFDNGTTKWSVVATDLNDNQDIINASFDLPGNVSIFNETSPESLINDREINATFFDLDGNVIFSRSTTDGDINLTNLSHTTFAVKLEDTGREQYETRQVIITDITVQDRVYMLNGSAPGIETVEPTFTIQDQTGDFGSTLSRVFVKRPLNISNSTKFKSIAGDEVGVDGYTPIIQNDTRYRIVVENPDGDRRVLGKFSATDSQSYSLQVEDVDLPISPDETQIRWTFNYTEVDGGDNTVTFSYSDPEEDTDRLEVVIYERGNRSNELHNSTQLGPIGNVTITETVPSQFSSSEWVVEWNADRNPHFNASRIVGPFGDIPIPLDDGLKHTIAIGFILLISGLASKVNAPAVAVGASGTAGIALYIQWLPTAVGGGIIIMALFVSGLYIVNAEGSLR